MEPLPTSVDAANGSSSAEANDSVNDRENCRGTDAYDLDTGTGCGNANGDGNDAVTVNDIQLTTATTSLLGPSQDSNTDAHPDEENRLVHPKKKFVKSASFDTGVVSPSRPMPLRRFESDPITDCERNTAAEQHLPPQRKSSRLTPVAEIRRLFGTLPFAPSFRSRRMSLDTFYCNICLENCSSTMGFIIASCELQHKYCRDCLQGYYTAQVNDGAVEHYCPGVGDGCKGHLASNELASLVGSDTLERYERLVQVKKNPLYRECPTCNVGITLPDQAPTIKCGNCAAEYCFFHSNAHVGLSCETYVRSQSRRTRDELRATAQLVGSTTRNCPHCQSPTEKNGGCNHM
jgi:hypothetical protein